MKDKKYVMMGGFAFSDKTDMKKLKKLAKKGWLLSGSKFLWYQLEKGEPQDLDFAVDYREELDEDYLLAFEKSGWKLELSIANVHVFSAKEGTRPIYTDNDSEIEKLKYQELSLKKPAIISSLLLVAFLVLDVLIIPATGFMHFLWTMGTTALMIATVFTVMPYFGYKIRRRLLRKKDIHK